MLGNMTLTVFFVVFFLSQVLQFTMRRKVTIPMTIQLEGFWSFCFAGYNTCKFNEQRLLIFFEWIETSGWNGGKTLWMKGQVLHRERAHLKVPDWSLVWNELLTKKLPMFLSRLNEISGGCEKIVPVSESFWSNLKFLRMLDLTAWLWGWNDGLTWVVRFVDFR